MTRRMSRQLKFCLSIRISKKHKIKDFFGGPFSMPIFEKGKRRQALEKHVIKIKQIQFFHLLLTSNRSVTIM